MKIYIFAVYFTEDMDSNILITQISEREYLVGQNETRLIEPNIIYVIAKGIQTDELAEKQFVIDQKLGSLVEGQISYLIDLNQCGKNSPKARLRWRELCDEDKTDKVAIFGVHPVAKVIASFVMRVTNKKNQRFFNLKEDALRWLLQS